MNPTTLPLRKQLALASRIVTAATLALAGGLAAAQDDMAVSVESVPAFPAFQQWVTTYVVVLPESPVALVRPVPVAPWPASPAGADYRPLPVILAQPELPLVGSGTGQVGKAWNGSFNYQGVHMRQVVLDSRGQQRDVRAMAYKPKAGERFKIRVTATFDAVADVDLVAGSAWELRRVGQFYPQKGMSVQLKAGETVDLPLAPNEFFVMKLPADDRMVVSVRHAQAIGDARSDQPAYRQDGRNGSSYLQLVPKGRFPAVEQLVSPAR